MYIDEGKYAEAEALARGALATEKKIEPDSFSRFTAAGVLGASLAGAKKYGEAEPLLQEGYQGMQAMKERIPAGYAFYAKFAHHWLVRVQARSKLGAPGE